MYWSRTGSVLDLIAWGILFTLSWAGGWLLCASLFSLRKREKPLVGMGAGFLLFTLVTNLLAFTIPLPVAYWCASVSIFLSGAFTAWRTGYFTQIRLCEIVSHWKQAAAFLILMLFTSLVLRGLTIFDEYSNLPLVGTLASGIFPPRLYLNSDIPLFYHHGLHLFTASLVQVGGLMTWSAFDLSRSFTIVLTILLGWLWLRRYSKNPHFLLFGLTLILLASGTRWLLLFFSPTWLDHISNSISLQGSALETAPTLYAAMLKPWNIESGSPLSFPFAFANGIFPPLSMALGGSGAVPQLSLILLLLLARRQWQASNGIVFGLLLAALGLFAEYLLLMVLAGIILILLVTYFKKSNARELSSWLWLFLPSVILVPLMGGVLTGISRSIVARIARSSYDNLTFTGLSLRWPPAFTSSHLGSLSLFDPNQILVALAEIGPVLLLAPLSIWTIQTGITSRKLILSGVGVGAWIGVLAPLFLKLSFSDRDVSRIIGLGLFGWLIITLPWWWLYLRRKRSRWMLGFSFWALVIFSGLALFPSQWIAIQQTRYTYFVTEPDARMSRLHWADLERNAQMLDLSTPSRPGTLFGLSIGRAYMNIDTPFPEFAALLNNPDPNLIARAGYAYIYMDRDAWQNLSGMQKNAFERNCVRKVAEFRSVTNDFRRLYDIRQCAK